MREGSLMRRSFLRNPLLLAAVLVIATSGRVSGQNSANTSKAPISLTITSPAASVKSGTVVFVEAALKNESDHVYRVYTVASEDMDQGGWVYKVDVRDDKRRTPPETQYARTAIIPFSSAGALPLGPGKTRIDRINVSRLCDLSQPGKYTIQVRRFDWGSQSFVRSNEITVEVTP